LTTKVVFLDRDGVINKEVGYLHRIEDFKFIPGVFDTCNYFLSLKYQIIIVTNQSGIGRGLYTEDDFCILNDWMLNQFEQKGVNILDVFFCPHGPNDGCDCRKPKPGLFINAMKKYDIDMNKSWMIGDKEADIEAANNAGISQTIIVRSGHKINEKQTNAAFTLDSIHDAHELLS
jgi:D-glycero-D-manno-heptose 1,7-bisphosphate phosphatase